MVKCGNCEHWEPIRANTGTCFAPGVMYRSMTPEHTKCSRFKRHVVHDADCAIAVNGRHACSCKPNARLDRQEDAAR
jgi:hypothetical protein